MNCNTLGKVYRKYYLCLFQVTFLGIIVGGHVQEVFDIQLLENWDILVHKA